MRASRGLGAWVATTLLVGVVAAGASGGGGPAESVATAEPAAGEVVRSTTTTTSTPTTAATTTTSEVAIIETTTAPPTTVAPTTQPPTTAPAATTPPTEPPAPDPNAVPAPPGFAIVLGPEVYPANGLPYVHLRGTGCTGPGHTNGERFTFPFQYGVSADFMTVDGRQLLRTDPEHSQPGAGDWTSGFPPVEGAGEFLVAVTCVDSNTQAEPNAGPWIAPVLEYDVQRFTVPG